MKLTNQQIVILAVCAFFLFIYQFVYAPGRKKLRTLDAAIAQKTRDEAVLKSLCTQYRTSAKPDTTEIYYAEPAFSLIAFLGSLVEKNNLGAFMKEAKPLPDQVQGTTLFQRVRFTMSDLSLETLYRCLQQIENSPTHIYISNFRMKKNREKPYVVETEIELLIVKKSSSPATARPVTSKSAIRNPQSAME